MIEDILEKYRNLCTHRGQFYIITSPYIFSILIIIALCICYSLLNKFISPSINIYLSLGITFLIEMLYISISQFYIFKKEQKYIVNKLHSFIDSKLNKETKNKLNDKLTTINDMKFQKKYIFQSNPIDEIFYKLKYDEFLKISHINNSEKADKLIRSINKFLENKNYVKEYIDAAFFKIIAVMILQPIIEYLKLVYMSDTTEVKWSHILMFILSIIPFIIIPISINYFIKKMNYSQTKKDKRMLFNISNNLSTYNFDIDEIDRYLDIEINNN